MFGTIYIKYFFNNKTVEKIIIKIYSELSVYAMQVFQVSDYNGLTTCFLHPLKTNLQEIWLKNFGKKFGKKIVSNVYLQRMKIGNDDWKWQRTHLDKMFVFQKNKKYFISLQTQMIHFFWWNISLIMHRRKNPVFVAPNFFSLPQKIIQLRLKLNTNVWAVTFQYNSFF